jgi:TolB protein
MVLVIASVTWAQAKNYTKLPAEKAGKIGVPLGKIAFIRDKNLMVMDWDGRSQQELVTVGNADGKLSWAPDGKRVVFVRKGKFNYQSPDNMGGYRTLFDVFIGYLDSAATNTGFWRRISFNMGSRHPEWSADGSRIYITSDQNSHLVDSPGPEYRTTIIDTIGNVISTHGEYPKGSKTFEIMPTFGPNNYYAYVLVKDFNSVGVFISPLDTKSMTSEEKKQKIKSIPGGYAPAWSPDGNWIAYMTKELSNQGIYITRPDRSETYLVYRPTVGLDLQTYPLSWSPDSQWLTFATKDGAVWIINIIGDGLKQVVGPGMNSAPAWSKNK